jgi:leucyl-tRNA synthetase
MQPQEPYDFQNIEKKWQDSWYSKNLYAAVDQSEKEKKYILVEFPFPSGASLHMGHLFRYTVPDIYARFMRHQGYNVLFPMGWDAFGLPAEEYARKHGKNPAETTTENIAKFKDQIKKFGFGIDWNREFATTDPAYYKWTQWIFKKFYEAGLAEQKEVELWFCEALGTVLANEEVYDGVNGEKLSERGDHPVYKKKMKQWILKITEYGQKLLDGLEETNFPEHIKAMQKSWIGKSEGVVVDWPLVPKSEISDFNRLPHFDLSKEGDETSESLKNSLYMRERAVALLQIDKTDKFLAFTQKNEVNNYNFLAGGALEFGETPQMAVKREILEELGIDDIEINKFIDSVSVVGYHNNQKLRSIEHYLYGKVTQESINNRKKAELDDINKSMFGEVTQVTLNELKGNNWPQLNHIIEKLENNTIEELEINSSDIVNVLVATSNLSKIKRLEDFVKLKNVSFTTPTPDLYEVNIIENGETEVENAEVKAIGFYNLQKNVINPTLGQDTGIYFDGVPDSNQPGKNTKKIAGVTETDKEEVVFEKMTNFYKNLVEKYGKNGELEGYFLDAYALFDGVKSYTKTIKRPIILTNLINDKDDLNFPLCSMYKTKLHNKYHNTLSQQEKSEFLKESMTGVSELISNRLELDSMTTSEVISTFTTRVDTLPSCTFIVLSPEYITHDSFLDDVYISQVQEYQEVSTNKSERERQINKEKSGVFTGRFVRNPITNGISPVWMSDFVLGGYGTGAVMGDAHDERDVELALLYNIYLQENVTIDGKPRENFIDLLHGGSVQTEKGILFASDKYNGLTSEEAKIEITKDLVASSNGHVQTNWRLRDWVFSRQRYWGEPFPIEYNLAGNVVLIQDNDLPLTLPQLDNFTPSPDGRSPLAESDWISIKDDSGITGYHEADTMPNWAGSSWYYLRFCDPKNNNEFASQKNLKYWLPVDQYFGGSEHTTMHLLYSRFWHKFLFDTKLVPTSEPYKTRTNGGILLGEDGTKMSKSKGNIIQPDEKLSRVGADALRLYIAFIGPYDATVVWQEGGLIACKRVIDTIWKLQNRVIKECESTELTISYHKYLYQVTNMLKSMKANTAVSQIMILLNTMKNQKNISLDIWKSFLVTIAPFTPHVASELWHQHHPSEDIHLQPWPKFDESKLVTETIKMVVQVNGKIRGEIQVDSDTTDDKILELATKTADKYLENKPIKFSKIIPKKLITIVV